jgi:hypothetical protein
MTKPANLPHSPVPMTDCPHRNLVERINPYGGVTACGYGCARTGGHCRYDAVRCAQRMEELRKDTRS